MKAEIVIDLMAWRLFKIALEDAIASIDDSDKFDAVNNMLLVIEENTTQPEAAQ